MHSQRSYEDGFLIILLVLAVFGLIWLFSPFLQALFFAMILATATFPFYQNLLQRFKDNSLKASTVMSLLVFAVVIVPVSYLLVEMSLQVGHLVGVAQAWLNSQTPDSIAEINKQLFSYFSIDSETQQQLLTQIKAQAGKLIAFAQDTVVFLLQGMVGTTASFLTFIFLSVFALFFFYRDGTNIAQHLKVLSPLENHHDTMLMDRFASLSSVLLLSILGVAILQGLTFAVVAWSLGLPGMFIGLAIAVTSFIPVVGAALVWVPVAIYLAMQGDYISVGVVVFFGVVINGFIIDNIARPIMINKIAASMHEVDLSVANHTLITVLSTFAGLIHFGVLGLFFGPVIAAMAISIFDVYEHKHRDVLDKT